MECILFEVSEGVGLITLNRQEKLNALNAQTLQELTQTVDHCLSNPDVFGVLITGAGTKAFAAGADIAELATFDSHSGAVMARQIQHRLFDVIARSMKPFVACINGYALGGGLELALACHLRYASENAVLGLPELSLGLIPGYGGTQRLTEAVGKAKAIEMILTAEMVSAQKALSAGLINEIVPQDELVVHGLKKLRNIRQKAPLAVQACLKAITAYGDKEANGYEIEIEEFGRLFGTRDFREGAKAFLEKRVPNFMGE